MQTLLGLAAMGQGVAIAMASQAEVNVPGVAYRAIEESDGVIEVHLAWLPELEDAVIGRFVAFMRDESVRRTR